MNYLIHNKDGKLNNEMHLITYDQIRQLYEENKRDEEEVNRVTASSNRGETYYNDGRTPGNEKMDNSLHAFFKEVMYRDTKTSGFLMQYPHGVVIRQGERNHYYRGENQIFEKSQPTLLRKLTQIGNDERRELYRLLAYMRIAEFKSFISEFDIVKNWQYGDVLYEPLAQHYGLETEWLDITNDFNVALFFATCYWDSKENRWLPLTNKQTQKNENTKYGVIFHVPSWQAQFHLGAAYSPPHIREDLKANGILPIGFQPFMRCQSQYAYGIKMEKPFPLQDDIMFEKLYFKHSEKLSQKVFDLMGQGSKIYPQEGLNEFQDIIERIRATNEFSEGAFEEACSILEINNLECYKESLSRLGIQIINGIHPYKISRQRLRALNRKYADFALEKNFGIKFHYRLTRHSLE